MAGHELQEYETKALVVLFQDMLIGITAFKPGIILRKLTPCLGKLKRESERWTRTGDLGDESYIIAMFQIETILYFSMVKIFSSDCLAGVTLDKLKICETIVRAIMKKTPDAQLRSYGFTENLSHQYFVILKKMKQLDKDVSIPLLLLSYFSHNSTRIDIHVLID